MSLALKREGDFDQVLEIARAALEAIPRNANLLNSLAWAFFEFGPPGHLPHAEQWARKAIELKPVRMGAKLDHLVPAEQWELRGQELRAF